MFLVSLVCLIPSRWKKCCSRSQLLVGFLLLRGFHIPLRIHGTNGIGTHIWVIIYGKLVVLVGKYLPIPWIVRGLTITMVINHLRPSWDDPPSARHETCVLFASTTPFDSYPYRRADFCERAVLRYCFWERNGYLVVPDTWAMKKIPHVTPKNRMFHQSRRIHVWYMVKVYVAIWAMKKRAPGCLGFIGDEILPSYMGIVKNHYKDPHQKISIIIRIQNPP